MTTPNLKTKRRRLFFDIETSPNIGLFWEAGYKKNIDYLAISDDIYDWILEYYEKSEGSNVKIKEIYKIFSSSEYFKNLSKAKKREYNYKFFVSKLESNLFLKYNVATNNDKVLILKNYKLKHIDHDNIDKNIFIDV